MSKAFTRSNFTTLTLILASSFVALACAKKPAESPKEEPEPVAAEPEPSSGQDPGQATVAISPTIAQACGISEPDAFFGYNSSKVSSSADHVLQQLATCFTSGPLAGKRMSLVGHTDPRGDEEYNLTLGGRRADNVKAALSKKGLPDGQMQTTSRGQMEASGSDEASWAKDRKVEIALVD